MPNQYKNKVVYGDSVLMDITDTTAEAGDVASGAVFYAKNGARTVGTFVQAQSDWEEDDTTDPAFILNKPTIPSASSSTPLADGTASAGSSTAYARGDHVHPVSSLAALSDTIVSSPSSGQALVYDGTSSKWVNASVSASDIGAIPAPQAVNDGQFLKYKQLSQGVYGWGVTDLYAELNNTTAVFYELEPTNGGSFIVEETFANIYQIFSSARKAYFIAIDSSTGDVCIFTIVGVNSYTQTILLLSASNVHEENFLRLTLYADNEHNLMYGSISTITVPNLYDTTLQILSDTTISNPSSGQVLTYDDTSSKWVNSTLTLPSASSTTPLADGTAAIGTSTAYARADHVHPVSSLSALSDTALYSPSNGQVLRYNTTTSKWENSTLPTQYAYGSTNPDYSDYISPALASLYITDDYRNLVMSHSANVYGQLFFNSWNVASSAGLIVSNVILYNNGLLCATLIGNTASNTWTFTVYPIQDALTFDSTPTNSSTNPVTSGGVYTALSSKANSADIPSASSSAPLVDGASAVVGTSTAYARADHVHPKIPIDSALSTTSENPVQNKVIQNALVNKLDFNTNYNPIPLDFPDPENPPATLDGATITCGLDFADILELYQLAIDTSFELLDIIQNHNFIVFHPFRINDANESIELFSIFDNTIYTITLEPNIDSGMTHGMIGTLHVKDSVTIDSALSSSSTNPVTNSAITTAIANNRGKVFYGVVDNTSTATAFTAQIPGITAYEEGLVVILKNGVVTSASGFTININGLGALPAYTNLGAASRETTIFNVAYTMMFVYEHRVSGGDWLCYRGSDANTNTIGYQLRTNSMSLPMKSVTYRYRLLFTSADGAHFVPANNTTSTNATSSRAVCQDKIDPFGPIYYYGTTASVGVGSRPSVTYLWEQYTVSLGYSFNRTGAALTLSSWKPVYVKCAPQADGSAIMDATTPYVQDLPTTADGKIYIFLGVAYNATNIELVPHHPVYCYRNGGIQEWTGVQAEIDALTARINNLIDGDEVSY